MEWCAGGGEIHQEEKGVWEKIRPMRQCGWGDRRKSEDGTLIGGVLTDRFSFSFRCARSSFYPSLCFPVGVCKRRITTTAAGAAVLAARRRKNVPVARSLPSLCSSPSSRPSLTRTLRILSRANTSFSSSPPPSFSSHPKRRRRSEESTTVVSKRRPPTKEKTKGDAGRTGAATRSTSRVASSSSMGSRKNNKNTVKSTRIQRPPKRPPFSRPSTVVARHTKTGPHSKKGASVLLPASHSCSPRSLRESPSPLSSSSSFTVRKHRSTSPYHTARHVGDKAKKSPPPPPLPYFASRIAGPPVESPSSLRMLSHELSHFLYDASCGKWEENINDFTKNDDDEDEVEEEVELDASLFEDEKSDDPSEANPSSPKAEDTMDVWKTPPPKKSQTAGCFPPAGPSASAHVVLPRRVSGRRTPPAPTPIGTRVLRRYRTPVMGEERRIAFTTNGDSLTSCPPPPLPKASSTPASLVYVSTTHPKTTRQEDPSPSQDIETERMPSWVRRANKERETVCTEGTAAERSPFAPPVLAMPRASSVLRESTAEEKSAEMNPQRGEVEAVREMGRDTVHSSSPTPTCHSTDPSYWMETKAYQRTPQEEAETAGGGGGGEHAQATLPTYVRWGVPSRENDANGVKMPSCRGYPASSPSPPPPPTIPTLGVSLPPCLSTFYPECEKWQAHDTFFLSAMSGEMDS